MPVYRWVGAGSRIALCAAAVSLAACEVNLNTEGVVSRETKSFKVAGIPDVQLDTFDGAIEVHSWDRNEVEVEIERRAMEQTLVDQMNVTAEQQGDRIVIKVTGPGRSSEFEGIQIGTHFSPSARLRVALPRKSQLAAKTGDGSITVEDLSGKIAITTSDGSVRATRLSGDITVRSGDGSIRMERIEGKVDRRNRRWQHRPRGQAHHASRPDFGRSDQTGDRAGHDDDRGLGSADHRWIGDRDAPDRIQRSARRRNPRRLGPRPLAWRQR